uniref:MARVEL domain-containing protein n=1 Tax=Globodera pallida TaxID=36090 RepID=A0A183C9X3_GLOPA
MDFDPEHVKWQCCFCRIPTGLKFLGVVDCAVAAGVLLLGLHFIHVHATTDKEGYFFLFDLSLAAISLLFGLSSLLMIAGVQLHREKLLYPTVVLRVVLVIFVTVFGVSIGVVRPVFEEEEAEEEPSIALRLVFLMFVMVLISIVVFYTIFLVLRTIRFIKAHKRLQRRRSSFFLVGQIDPSLMHLKRPSQCSQTY